MDKEEFMNDGVALCLPERMRSIIRALEVSGRYASVHTYRCALRSFTEFAGSVVMSGPAADVFTSGRLKSYQNWLLGKELSWNSISIYMRTLRAAYNRIFPPGSPGYVPGLFDEVYTRVESQTKRALSGEQMQVLLSPRCGCVGIEGDVLRALRYFRLMFLFRGMPFIDLAYLRKRDLKGDVLSYCRHKTGRRLTVRVPEEAAALLKEVADTNPASIYLFPILDGSLHEGASLYRCYLGALRRFNRNLRKVGVLLLGSAGISSYTARHTWATLAFHLCTPVGIISEALGHSSVRVTETYLKPFGNERVDKANDFLITSVIMRDKKNNDLFNPLYNRRL